MSTTGPRSQIPLNRAMVDSKGMITVPWSFWFQSQNAGLPPAGAGYVIDGSASQVTMTLFQGADSQKGSPQSGYIYFALDTNKTYVVQGNQWVLQDPAYTGDVTKSAGSTVTSLANVFLSPGTYGNSTTTPILTIDSKGRIIDLQLQAISVVATPAGLPGQIQYNNSGTLGGAAGVVYVNSTQSLGVTGNVVASTFIGNLIGNVTANLVTANVINANAITSNTFTSNTANITGNLVSGNISTGELSANIILGNTANITGNLVSGNISTGELSANIILGNTANITGNVDIGNFLSVVGNASIGNVSTNLLSANTANITGNIDIGGNINYTRTFGAFYSNATQNSAGANATNYFSFNNTDYANGISITSNNQITFNKVGFYNIQFSAVLQHTVNQTADVEIWLSYNGNNVPWTNTAVTVAKDVKLPVAWDWTVQSANVNDYYQIAWASSDSSVRIVAVASANTIANVGIPSVILTVSPVGA